MMSLDDKISQFFLELEDYCGGQFGEGFHQQLKTLIEEGSLSPQRRSDWQPLINAPDNTRVLTTGMAINMFGKEVPMQCIGKFSPSNAAWEYDISSYNADYFMPLPAPKGEA